MPWRRLGRVAAGVAGGAIGYGTFGWPGAIAGFSGGASTFDKVFGIPTPKVVTPTGTETGRWAHDYYKNAFPGTTPWEWLGAGNPSGNVHGATISANSQRAINQAQMRNAQSLQNSDLIIKYQTAKMAANAQVASAAVPYGPDALHHVQRFMEGQHPEGGYDTPTAVSRDQLDVQWKNIDIKYRQLGLNDREVYTKEARVWGELQKLGSSLKLMDAQTGKLISGKNLDIADTILRTVQAEISQSESVLQAERAKLAADFARLEKEGYETANIRSSARNLFEILREDPDFSSLLIGTALTGAAGYAGARLAGAGKGPSTPKPPKPPGPGRMGKGLIGAAALIAYLSQRMRGRSDTMKTVRDIYNKKVGDAQVKATAKASVTRSRQEAARPKMDTIDGKPAPNIPPSSTRAGDPRSDPRWKTARDESMAKIRSIIGNVDGNTEGL